MAAFGIKAIQPQDNEHILGFATARATADDALLEIWNGPTNADLVYTMDRLGQHQSANGTASRPTYSWENSKATGWYRIGADNVGFAVNTTKLLDLAATALGLTGAFTASGIIKTDDVTDATSGTDGSLQTDGGLSIVKAAWIGTTLTTAGIVSVDDVTDTTSTTTGSIHTDGGLGIAKDLWVGAQLNVAGSGPHAIGVAAAGSIRLVISGNYTSDGSSNLLVGTSHGGTLTGAVGDTSSIIGTRYVNFITTQGTDTNIDLIAQVQIHEPNITNNLASSGKPDIAAALHIVGAPTEGDVNAALYVAAGDISTDGGTYTMLEIATPTARTNYGKIYCKTDNKLYFQDGAGTEHEVSFV